MDELKDKFKNLLTKGPSSSKKFQGQGHKLGSADAKPAKPRPAPPPPPASPRGASSSQQQPRQELKPATEFSPFTAVIGGGAARTSNSMNPAGLDASTDSQPRISPTGAGRQLGSAGQPLQQQQQQQPQRQPAAAVSSAVLEDLQHCLALISSQPDVAVSSMQVLQKLLSNLLTAPQEAKFRQLRLGPNPNPKIQAAVVDVPGALNFLQACGFEVLTDEQAPGSQEAGATHAYFLHDAQLSHVEAGLQQLQLALQTAQHAQPQQQQQPQQQAQPAASASAGSSSVASSQDSAAPPAAAGVPAAQQPAPPRVVARNTLVLLPAVPDTDVPEFFFQRTAAEVKAEFMSLLRSRQTKEVFASKAWKDLKLGATSSSGRQPAAVTLRVRFPEGVCLQGCFGVREPVSAVFQWVTSSLRHPGLTYELITPSRTPLAPTGKASTVGGADLAGAVLNFRGLSDTQRGYLVGERGRQLPFLSDALLARAQAD